jgi:hypothetical protein
VGVDNRWTAALRRLLVVLPGVDPAYRGASCVTLSEEKSR